MSAAGQNTFTGISAQADLSLLFLLEYYQNDDFIKILLEGDNYEDFTLFFEGKIQSYEAKWHKVLTYNGIRSILSKEIQKPVSYGEQFVILCKNISKNFRDDFEYLKNTLYFWYQFNKKSPEIENPIVQKFLKKGWSYKELEFLMKTEIIEFHSEAEVKNRITDYFVSQDDFYFSEVDSELVIAISFREIMEKSKNGGSIQKNDFIELLKKVKLNISRKSESFSPELYIGKLDISKFLKNEKSFEKLNHEKNLSPLTLRNLTIYSLVEQLKEKKFTFKGILFFVEKVLIKKTYHFSILSLLENKYEQGKLDKNLYLKFLLKNYKFFKSDFIIRGLLEILFKMIEKNKDIVFCESALEFIKTHLLVPFNILLQRSTKNIADTPYKYKCVPNLIKKISLTLGNSEDFLDLLFKYFDFTSNDLPLVNDTHVEYFSWIKEYIKTSPEKNIIKVINKIEEQYIEKYGYFTGSELIGSSIQKIGNIYELHDKGMVELIFKPLFDELYKNNKLKAWKFIEKTALIWPKNGEVSKANPAFIKRAVIKVVMERMSDKNLKPAQRKEAFLYLEKILKMKKGLPNTSSCVFYNLLKGSWKLNPKDILALIKIDGNKYKQGDIPSNIFAYALLLKFSANGEKLFRMYFIYILKKEKFRSSNLFEDVVNLLGKKENIPLDIDFSIGILDVLRLPEYIDEKNCSFLDISFVAEVLKKTLSTKDNKFIDITSDFLNEKRKDTSVNFLGSVLIQLLDGVDIVNLSKLLSTYINKFSIKNQFTNCKNFKYFIIRLGEKLLSINEIKRAKKIVLLLIDDADPILNGDISCEYHLEIKNGGDTNIISTVRGYLCWLIQKFVVTNNVKNMQFAFACTKKIMDLDARFSDKMEYLETNNYIVTQAMIPLIELSDKKRRSLLQEADPTRVDRVKEFAIYLLSWTKNKIKSGSKIKKILENLVFIFLSIKDLAENEAEAVLDFFEENSVENSGPLFIYYAHYRSEEYCNIPFDPTSFRLRLKKLCGGKSNLRSKLSWNMWCIEEQNIHDSSISKKLLSEYWSALLDHYDSDVYTYASMVIESRLKNNIEIKETFNLLEKAIYNELKYLTNNPRYPKFNLKNIFCLVSIISINNFIKFLEIVLKMSDFQQGTNPYGMYFKQFSHIFNKIEKNKLKTIETKIYNNISKMFRNLRI